MKNGITLVRVNLAHGSERIRVREQQIQIYAFPFFFAKCFLPIGSQHFLCCAQKIRRTDYQRVLGRRSCSGLILVFYNFIVRFVFIWFRLNFAAPAAGAMRGLHLFFLWKVLFATFQYILITCSVERNFQLPRISSQPSFFVFWVGKGRLEKQTRILEALK